MEFSFCHLCPMKANMNLSILQLTIFETFQGTGGKKPNNTTTATQRYDYTVIQRRTWLHPGPQDPGAHGCRHPGPVHPAAQAHIPVT